MKIQQIIKITLILSIVGVLLVGGINKVTDLLSSKNTDAYLLEPITGTWVAEWNDRGFIKSETHYLVEHSSGKVFSAPSDIPKILGEVEFEIMPGLDARRVELKVTKNNFGPPKGYYYPLSEAIEFHYGNTLIHCTKDKESPVKWQLVLPKE